MAELTLVCLHGLGMSARLYEPVTAALAAHIDGADADVVALDLPGFGDRSGESATTVADSVDAVVREIVSRRLTRWLLVGHSMGAKIASVVARCALDGAPGLFGLAGVVLLAGSPPSPEPMDDEQRATMLGWAAEGALDTTAARTFVDENIGAALPADLDAIATADLRRCSRAAWVAWLEQGSREDRSATVGTLELPALLLAGGADGPLGASGQRLANAPVYPRAHVVTLPGAGHLLPLERPREVAAAILDFWRTQACPGAPVPPHWAHTIATNRVSTRTRSILATRALADDPAYQPAALTVAHLATLRLLADLLVPQDGPSDDVIDLAARVDAQLAAGQGDGWRPDSLPTDIKAYRSALDSLSDLEDLSPDERTGRVQAVIDATFEPSGDLSADQLSLWFEDARTDLVRQWLAHPATAARIGFDGYFNGGDGARLAGWQLLGAGERESWEPEPSR